MDALQLLQLIQNKKSHQTSYFSKNNFPNSKTHLTIQSEFPYQETLTNMDALQLLQLIQNKKSHQSSYFRNIDKYGCITFTTANSYQEISSNFDLMKVIGKGALPITFDLNPKF